MFGKLSPSCSSSTVPRLRREKVSKCTLSRSYTEEVGHNFCEINFISHAQYDNVQVLLTQRVDLVHRGVYCSLAMVMVPDSTRARWVLHNLACNIVYLYTEPLWLY